MKTIILGLLLVMLTACRSAPTQFYTLVPLTIAEQPEQPEQPEQTQPAPAPFAYQLQRVTVPTMVDRPQLMLSQGSGQVALLEAQQWAAPLGDEINTAIDQRLQQQLGASLLTPAADKPVEDYRIQLNITRFVSVPGKYTLLQANWQINNQAEPLLRCSSHIRETVSHGMVGIVEAHQRGVMQLADELGAALQQLHQSSGDNATVACPWGDGEG